MASIKLLLPAPFLFFFLPPLIYMCIIKKFGFTDLYNHASPLFGCLVSITSIK